MDNQNNEHIVGYWKAMDDDHNTSETTLFMRKHPLDVWYTIGPIQLKTGPREYEWMQANQNDVVLATSDSYTVKAVQKKQKFTLFSYIRHCIQYAIMNKHKLRSVNKACGTIHSNDQGSVVQANGKNSIAVSTYENNIATAEGSHNTIAVCNNACCAAVTCAESAVSVCTEYCSVAWANGKNSVALTTSALSVSYAENNGISIAIGIDSIVSGTTGSWLICAEWDERGTRIVRIKSAFVDNISIKENTWYRLKDGRFVPLSEQTDMSRKPRLRFICPQCMSEQHVEVLMTDCIASCKIDISNPDNYQYGYPKLLHSNNDSYHCENCGWKLPVKPEDPLNDDVMIEWLKEQKYNKNWDRQ